MNLLDFQDEAVSFLLDCCWRSRKRDIILKSPTGSGKTVMLLKMIHDYLQEESKTIFVWITPGTVDLEEQSSQRMNEMFPLIETQDVYDVISDGFNPKKVPFINWEMITKSGNTAIEKSDRKNLYDRIYEARLDDYQFILVIDEEHLYDTPKARNLIDKFQPKHIIRASATARRNDNAEYMSIPIDRVINSGLITKYIIVNDGLYDTDDDNSYENEAGELLTLAISKQIEIRNEYNNIGYNINPLIMVQLPNSSDDLLNSVEFFLDSKFGINYDNGRLARRLTGRYKGDLEDIKRYDSTIDVLIFKEAGNVGWDCPRAKILVKLRTGMSENFEIQTIGRIRRMPYQKHFDNQILDNAFLYTYDVKFSQSVIEDLENNAFRNISVSLKKDFSNILLFKEYKQDDVLEYGEREIYDAIYDYFYKKYNLKKDTEKNLNIFEFNKYSTSNQIETIFYQGNIVDISLEDLKESDIVRRKIDVDVSIHRSDLMHSISEISERIGLDYDRTKVILGKLFFKKETYGKKILNLSKKDYYAFIINNTPNIKQDIDEALSQETSQVQFAFPQSEWSIPETDKVRVSSLDNPRKMKKNVMDGYPYVPAKSRSEKEFEKYVEDSSFFKWIYKNGESANKHFSIVYGNKAKQKLFFPDYILKDKFDSIWIIETKGGEDSAGVDKNIDKEVRNKFLALAKYSEKNNIKFGFIRDSEVTDLLYISNTIYTDSLNEKNWVELDNFFN